MFVVKSKMEEKLLKTPTVKDLKIPHLYTCVCVCVRRCVVLLSLQGALDLFTGTLQEQQSSLKQTGLQPGRSPRGGEGEQRRKVPMCVCVGAFVQRATTEFSIFNSFLIF